MTMTTTTTSDPRAITSPPTTMRRLGLILERGGEGSFDSHVLGDPCIVWDDELDHYRMFYFAQRHVGDDEDNCVAEALATTAGNALPAGWEKLGPVTYTNPEAFNTDWGTHKPWILMDAFHPNHAAKIEGQYWLVSSTFQGKQKVIHVARSETLAGPWTIQEEPVIRRGHGGDIDAYHTDTPTAFWFADRGEVLLFYMAYPATPQPEQPHSPYGSNSCAAVMRPGDMVATKLGPTVRPIAQPGHRSFGWVGGLHLLPAADGGWWAITGGGTTPPPPIEESPNVREPAPAASGWAYTPEAWPVTGWSLEPAPIMSVDRLEPEALAEGEGHNLWRHHALISPDGKQIAIYYNTGAYGQERLFGRIGTLKP